MPLTPLQIGRDDWLFGSTLRLGSTSISSSQVRAHCSHKTKVCRLRKQSHVKDCGSELAFFFRNGRIRLGYRNYNSC